MTPSAQDIAVFVPLIIGLPVTLGTIVIHGLAVVAIVEFVRYQRRIGAVAVTFWRGLAIVAGATMFAAAAHFLEILLWGIVFTLCGEFSQLASAFYDSAMKYTSLGCGDVVMSASWKLFGPLETADGMLMFGVSTAMIFAVIQGLIQTKFRDAGT